MGVELKVILGQGRPKEARTLSQVQVGHVWFMEKRFKVAAGVPGGK